MKTSNPKTKIVVKTRYPCGGREKIVIELNSAELTAEEMLRNFVNSMAAQSYAQNCIEDAILTLASEIEPKTNNEDLGYTFS